MSNPPDNPSKDDDEGHSFLDGVGNPHDTVSAPADHGTTPPASDDGGHSRPRTPLPRFRSYGSSQFRTPQRDRTLTPKDTPIAYSNSSLAHASDDTDSESVHRRHAEDAKKRIVGPMPVEQFLSAFFPESELPETDDNGLSMPDPTGAFDAVPSVPAQESHLYQPLITAINTPQRCPSVTFYNTSNNSLETGKGTLRPDLCAYHPDELSAVTKDDKVTAELGHAEIFAEVKVKKDRDPFVDPPNDIRDPAAISRHEFIRIGEFDISRNTDRSNTPQYREARKALGQNVSYAIAASARQHRMFYFSIFIIGTNARLIRWDRSGAIVTRAFDYKLQPELLCQFLWRFGLSTPSQRGYDPTVVKATDAEDELYRRAIRDEVAFQLGLDAERDAVKLDEALLRHYSKGRVTKMEVYDRRRDAIHQFLISRPVQSPLSMAGRSTRGQWAVKVDGDDAKKVFFIKDTWRAIVDRMDPEGDAYDDINGNDVTNVGTMYCEGDIPMYVEDAPDWFDTEESQDEVLETQEMSAQPDVKIKDHVARSQAVSQVDLPDSQIENVTCAEEDTSEPAVQSTRTQEFANANWSCRGGRRVRVFKRIHYRLVLEEVGYPLSELTGTRELFEATHDVLLAIIDAKRKCGRLHRDISIDNILLVRKRGTIRRQGVLIDWELSTLIDRDGMARDYDRSGTWAFMSLALLSNAGGFRHSIADDMESLLYVVLFCCARWIPHNDVIKLGSLILKFFFQADQDGGDDEGGAYKALQRSTRYFTKKLQFSDRTVDKWFLYIYELLAPSEKAGKWEESTVEPLWRKMRNCNLSDGDRYEHDVGDVFGERPSFFATRTTHTAESISSSSKRPAETNLDVPERSSKRRRGESGEVNEPIDGGADSGQG